MADNNNNVNPFQSVLLPYQWEIFKDDSDFIIAMISRQCGKSLTMSAKAVYQSIMYMNELTLLVSVNQRSADELLKKAKQWAQVVKMCGKGLIDYTETASSITFNNGSRIVSVPASPSALRGWSGNVILDEFALVENDKDIFQAVLPVITNKLKGRQYKLWICSTPSSLDTQFAKIWFDNDNGFKKYEYTIYECVEQGLKCDIESIRNVINDDLIFNTEYLCQFASGASSAFPNDKLIDIGETKYQSSDFYLGYDVARKRDFSAFVIGAFDRVSGVFHIVDIFILRNKTFEEQFKFVQELDGKYHFQGGYVDSSGMGMMMGEQITQKLNPRIRSLTWTSVNKTLLHDNLRTVICDSKFKVSEEYVQMVKKDFQNMRRYISDNGKISYSAPHSSDGHSDITSAIVLCLESAKRHPYSNIMPISHSHASSRLGNRISRL